MKRLFFLVTVVLISVSIFSRQDSSAIKSMFQFVQNIRVFNRLYPQEKVYLHFDNTGYYLGETIWFKAYAVNAGDHRPTGDSRVLYVELLNPRGILLETKKLKIVDGQCHGDFFLTTFDHDYHGGFYEIRAYTKMMLNFGEETVFSRVFPVFNEPEKEGDYTTDMKEGSDVRRLNLPRERKNPKKKKKVNLDFYPEGGNLIHGLTSTVAFKATDEKGFGIDVTGEIINEKKETVTTFSSIHGGMGSFEYKPGESKDKVKILYGKKIYDFDLPESLPEGYVLKANNFLKKALVLQIEKSPERSAIPLGLSVLCRGQVVLFQTLQPDSLLVLRIPGEELPAGVNQITLFDAKGEIYAERLVFISPTKEERQRYAIKAVPNKNTYKPQERIGIDFSTATPEATFSLSVRDAANTVITTDAGNIMTNFLLSSDLKGWIENPSYYFEPDDAGSRTIALDLLMLVQGWKRYGWQEMAGRKPFTQVYDMEKGLKVKGQVVGKSKEVKMEMTLENGDFIVGTTEVDSLGNFVINIHEDLYGEYYMLLGSPGLKKAHLNIRLDKWFSPVPKSYSFLETVVDRMGKTMTKESGTSSIVAYQSADDSIKIHEFPELKVKEKRGKDLIYHVERDRERRIDAGNGYPVMAHQYLQEKNNSIIYRINNNANSWESLPEGVWESDIVRGGNWIWGRRTISTIRLETGRKQTGAEIYARRYNRHIRTMEIDLEDIQKIVVREWNVSSSYFVPDELETWETPIGNYGYYVPFYFYLYGKLTPYYPYWRNPDFRVTSFDAYSCVKDFYTDRPERENYVPGRFEHSRTLYWNPNVKTDQKGKARISFYNNAFCRKIDVSAEGLARDGYPITNKK